MSREIKSAIDNCQGIIEHVRSRINTQACIVCQLPMCKEIPNLNSNIRRLANLIKKDKPEYANRLESGAVNAAV